MVKKVGSLGFGFVIEIAAGEQVGDKKRFGLGEHFVFAAGVALAVIGADVGYFGGYGADVTGKTLAGGDDVADCGERGRVIIGVGGDEFVNILVGRRSLLRKIGRAHV